MKVLCKLKVQGKCQLLLQFGGVGGGVEKLILGHRALLSLVLTVLGEEALTLAFTLVPSDHVLLTSKESTGLRGCAHSDPMHLLCTALLAPGALIPCPDGPSLLSCPDGAFHQVHSSKGRSCCLCEPLALIVEV